MTKNPEQQTFHEQWQDEQPEKAPEKPKPIKEDDPACDYCNDGEGGCRYCGFGRKKKK
jgi:hypothetical protein